VLLPDKRVGRHREELIVVFRAKRPERHQRPYQDGLKIKGHDLIAGVP
jgi:hypothetical protein